MVRQLYDLCIGTVDAAFVEFTTGLDLDDEEATDQALTWHLCAAIRTAGGGPEDLPNWAVEVRRAGYERLLMTFQTDTWIEE